MKVTYLNDGSVISFPVFYYMFICVSIFPHSKFQESFQHPTTHRKGYGLGEVSVHPALAPNPRGFGSNKGCGVMAQKIKMVDVCVWEGEGCKSSGE